LQEGGVPNAALTKCEEPVQRPFRTAQCASQKPESVMKHLRTPLTSLNLENFPSSLQGRGGQSHKPPDNTWRWNM